jgi:hypothetical protein
MMPSTLRRGNQGRESAVDVNETLVASIWFRNVGLTDVSGGRVFSELTPSLSHFDEKGPLIGMQCRARLLKTSRRIALVIFYRAHFPQYART